MGPPCLVYKPGDNLRSRKPPCYLGFSQTVQLWIPGFCFGFQHCCIPRRYSLMRRISVNSELEPFHCFCNINGYFVEGQYNLKLGQMSLVLVSHFSKTTIWRWNVYRFRKLFSWNISFILYKSYFTRANESIISVTFCWPFMRGNSFS